MDVGGQLLLALVRDQATQEYIRYQLKEDLFYGSEVPIWQFISGYLSKHHQLPKIETLQIEFPDLPKAVEPPMFYLDQVEQRYAHKTLNRALLDANTLMKEQDSWTALNMVEECVHQLRSRELGKGVVDFGQSTIVADEIRRIKLEAEDSGVKLGWPTFDTMSGGVRDGDIVSIIGRPAMGKTWFLLYIAHHMWSARGQNVLVVSMEMDTLSIAQRLTAITSGVTAKHIRVAELTGIETGRLTKAMKKAKSKENKLWLMDGNLNAEVEQIFTMVRHLHPSVVLIDGAYLLGHPDKRLDKFRRVDSNMELLKSRASMCGVPVIASFQFNRQAVKKYGKGKQEGGGLEDIAHADAIGQISSAVLAMHQEESVETATQRIINVLKCRTGQVGKFSVHWDFHKMDFSEVMPEQVSQMKFV